MANTVDIVFKTDRFNLSEIKEHFINDGCFGEDLAAWLREKLVGEGYAVDEPFQEDWGWAFFAENAPNRYFIGVGGTSDEESGRPNFGELRVIIELKRSIKDKLLGRRPDDPLPGVIERILRAEPDFSEVHQEL